jgi:HK97 gp10 family phage protein
MNVKITENNTDKVEKALAEAVETALEKIGIKAHEYAVKRCPVGTEESTGIKGYRGGTLRNSIAYEVGEVNGTPAMTIGSNVEYAPYVELGTRGNFQAPPPWEEVNVPKGSGSGKGGMKPRPYLKPAIEDHIDEYNQIIKDTLGNSGT